MLTECEAVKESFAIVFGVEGKIRIVSGWGC